MYGSYKFPDEGNVSDATQTTFVLNFTESIVPPIVSDNVLWWLRMIVVGILCQSLALFGVVTNIINIVVFTKLGIKDPINVSLIGLSISDSFSCLAIMWYNLCLFPPFMELELPFEQLGAHYLFGSWPHATCVKISAHITAFITIERCLCVTYPLKVKEIITTKRVVIITVLLYIVNVAMVSPVYYVNRYAWVFSPERNRTIYTLVFTEDRRDIEPMTFFFVAVFFPIVSFILSVIATIILVYILKKNAKWRQEATGQSTNSSQTTSSGNKALSRDAKIAKMVVMMSVLYLICFCPLMVTSGVVVIDPEISEGGLKENLLHAIIIFNFLFETTNAALNIFIYYYMSSNYNSMFTAIFKTRTSTDKAL